LLGAFESQSSIIPVKLEIKKERDVQHGSLYVVVSMTEIKKSDVMGRTYDAEKATDLLPVTGSVYSLPQIISKVNIQDADFLKYIPDQMLSGEQRTAKQAAIAKDNAKNIELGGKGEISYSYEDSDGNELSEGQREFFKDSKVRDEEGNLLKVYHGTDAEFNTFKQGRGQLGEYGSYGIFFSDKATAESYGNTKAFYLNAKNVKVIDAQGQRGVAIGTDSFGTERGRNKILSTDDIVMLADEEGYDGVIIKNVRDNGDDANSHIGTVYAVMNPNQIKLTSNLNPTEDEDGGNQRITFGEGVSLPPSSKKSVQKLSKIFKNAKNVYAM